MRIEFKVLIVLGLTLICLCFWVKKCQAIDMFFGYGQDVPITSWQSEGLEYSVLQLEISQDVNSWLCGSLILNRLESKLNSSQIIDGKHFSSSVNGLALSSRVTLQRTIHDRLYGKLFGGFGILPQVMPEIGNSGIVGHFGVGVKYSTLKWEIGYEWTHMSDPLQHGDKGWNWQMLTLGWRF